MSVSAPPKATVPAGAGPNRGSSPMRRSLGPALAGVGALLMVVGLLSHFYVVPKLAVVPMDQNSVTSLEAKGATLFDTATLKDITTDLSIKARTVGDVAASQKAPGNAVVWVSTTSIRSSDGVIRSRSVERAAFDKKTAEAVNCCDSFNESTEGERTPVVRQGLVFKFPFGTTKKTYQVWNDSLGKTVDTKYVGTSKVQGLSVYKFESSVPSTVVGQQDVPASVMGMSGQQNVSADSNYQNDTTYYVEPVTGAIINQVTDQLSTFTYQGHQLITTKALISYTPAQVTQMVNDIKGKASSLALANGFVPWLVVLFGLGLIGYSGLRERRRK